MNDDHPADPGPRAQPPHRRDGLRAPRRARPAGRTRYRARPDPGGARGGGARGWTPGSARRSTPRCRPSGWPPRRPWACSRRRRRPSLEAGRPRRKRSRRRRHRCKAHPPGIPSPTGAAASPSLAGSSPRRRRRRPGARARTTKSSGGRSSGAPGAAEMLLHRFYDHGLAQASYLLGCERTARRSWSTPTATSRSTSRPRRRSGSGSPTSPRPTFTPTS